MADQPTDSTEPGVGAVWDAIDALRADVAKLQARVDELEEPGE